LTFEGFVNSNLGEPPTLDRALLNSLSAHEWCRWEASAIAHAYIGILLQQSMAEYEHIVQGVFLSDGCDHSVVLDLVILIADITLDCSGAWDAIEYYLDPEGSNGDAVSHSNPILNRSHNIVVGLVESFIEVGLGDESSLHTPNIYRPAVRHRPSW